jgi:hypothetical protein
MPFGQTFFQTWRQPNLDTTYQAATLTSGDFWPTRIARIEYPVLCQSMISFAPDAADTSCASASVGIDGGFCCQPYSRPPYLDKQQLGMIGNTESAEVEDGEELVCYPYGRAEDPGETACKGRRVVKV